MSSGKKNRRQRDVRKGTDLRNKERPVKTVQVLTGRSLLQKRPLRNLCQKYTDHSKVENVYMSKETEMNRLLIKRNEISSNKNKLTMTCADRLYIKLRLQTRFYNFGITEYVTHFKIGANGKLDDCERTIPSI